MSRMQHCILAASSRLRPAASSRIDTASEPASDKALAFDEGTLCSSRGQGVVPVLGHTCLVKKQTRALSPEPAAVSLNLFLQPPGHYSDNATCGTIRLCVYLLATGILIE